MGPSVKSLFTKMGFANVVLISVAIPVLHAISASLTLSFLHTGLIQKYVLPELAKHHVTEATLAQFCVAISFLLSFFSFYPAIFYKALTSKGVDNSNPRDGRKNTGLEGRLLGTHTNATENMLYFAVAVLVALSSNVHIETLGVLCLIHLGFRFVFHLVYFLNISLLRSLCFCGGIDCIAMIYMLAFCPDVLKFFFGLFGEHFGEHIDKVVGLASPSPHAEL